MKKVIFTLIAFGFVFNSMAQRFGYVDSNYILESIPEYQQKQERTKRDFGSMAI